MAKCGCASDTCSCLVTGGTGITVTGNGSTASPYIVSFGGVASTYLSVTDTSTVDLTLAGDGSQATPYVLSAVATIPPGTDSTPPGVVTPYAGNSAPTGWLLATGQAVSRATYSALFSIIGTTYGAGDGSTTFNVPNLKGRIPVGMDSSQVEFDTQGETGGAKTHTLTVAETPGHTHVIDHDHGNVVTDAQGNHVHFYNVNYAQNHQLGGSGAAVLQVGGGGPGGGNFNATGATDTQGLHQHNVDLPNFSGSSGSAGGGGAHNNLQPYITLNYIIKI